MPEGLLRRNFYLLSVSASKVYNCISKLDRKYATLPYGLAVRIPGSHPGGPGSTPGVGTYLFVRYFFRGSTMKPISVMTIEMNSLRCPYYPVIEKTTNSFLWS